MIPEQRHDDVSPVRHRSRADSVAATAEWVARLRADPDTLDAFVAAWSADVKVVAELVIGHARVKRETWYDEAHQIALIELWDLGREIIDRDIDLSSIGGTLYRRTTLQFRRFHRSTAGNERVSGVTTWRRRDSARQQVAHDLTKRLGRRPNVDEMVSESQRRFADRRGVVDVLTEALGRRPSSKEITAACRDRHGHDGLVRPFQTEEIGFLPALSLDHPLTNDAETTFGDLVAASASFQYTDGGDSAADGTTTMIAAMRCAVIAEFDGPEAEAARMFFDDFGDVAVPDVMKATGLSNARARRVLQAVRERARQWWSERSEREEGPGSNAGASL